MGGERRVTTIGQAESNFLGIEYVRQVPGADQFDAISEDHDPDRGADEVVAVDQGIADSFRLSAQTWVASHPFPTALEIVVCRRSQTRETLNSVKLCPKRRRSKVSSRWSWWAGII